MRRAKEAGRNGERPRVQEGCERARKGDKSEGEGREPEELLVGWCGFGMSLMGCNWDNWCGAKLTRAMSTGR